MNEVKNTLVRESVQGEYVTPETKVIDLQSEGVLCSSVNGVEHEGFTFGDEYTI